MDGSLIVSIVALGIALGSLALALRADRRASRAESHGLQALVVVDAGSSSGSPSGRRFDFRVRNVGREVARDVDIWLEDESGRVVADSDGGSRPTLAPGESPVEISLTVPDRSLPPPPVTFSVWISWTDRTGHHDRAPAGIDVST